MTIVRANAWVSVFLGGAALLAVGCGSTSSSPEVIHHEVVDQDAPDPTLPTVKIVGLGNNVSISQALPDKLGIKLQVTDPQNKAFTKAVIDFTIEGQDPVIFVQDDKPKPVKGVLTYTMDTSGVPYGVGTLVAHICAQPLVVGDVDRTMDSVALTGVTVDNDAPVISRVEPDMPPTDSLVSTDLRLHFTFDDQGELGVACATISVAIAAETQPSFQWSYGCDDKTVSSGVVDSIDKGIAVFGTRDAFAAKGLKSGDITVTVTAADAIGNQAPVQVFHYRYVPTPNFATATVWPLDDFTGAAIAPLTCNGLPAVAIAGDKGVRVYRRNVDTGLPELLWEIPTPAASAVRVVDLDGNGRDDLVVRCGNRIIFFFQNPDNQETGFDQGDAEHGSDFTVDGGIAAFDLGPLNLDRFPDVAVAIGSSTGSFGLVMSIPGDLSTDPPKGWTVMKTYGGALNPTTIAIGRFTADPKSSEKRATVVLGRSGSPVFQRFFVNPENGEPAAADNAVLTLPGTSFDAFLATSLLPHEQSNGDFGLLLEGSSGTLIGIEYVELKVDPSGVKVANKWPTGLKPTHLALGQIDAESTNDTVPDVAVLCRDSQMVQVFWGAPDKKAPLVEGPAMLTGRNPVDVAIVKFSFDLDGKPVDTGDLVVLDEEGRSLTYLPYVVGTKTSPGRMFDGQRMIRLDKSQTAFAAGHFYTAGSPTKATKRDLAVLGSDENGNGSVALYAANNTWELPVDVQKTQATIALPAPAALVTANLDADATHDDLLIPCFTGGPATSTGTMKPTMAVLTYKGQGFTNPVKSFYAGDNPQILAVADLDNGGLSATPYFSVKDANDVAVVAQFPAPTSPGHAELRLQTFIGDGKGGFVSQSQGQIAPWIVDGVPVTSLVAAKVQGSAYNDLVVSRNLNGVGDFVPFFSMASALYFQPAKDVSLGAPVRGIAAGFMDGPSDELVDIVALLNDAIVIVYAEGKKAAATTVKGSNVTWSPAVSPFPLPEGGVTTFQVVDMNGDGYPDIVLMSGNNSTVYVYLNTGNHLVTGDHKFADPLVFGTGRGPKAMVIADFNADTCPDIATLDESGRSITFIKTQCNK